MELAAWLGGCRLIEQFPREEGTMSLRFTLQNVLGVIGRTWETTPGDPAGCHMMLRCLMFPRKGQGVWERPVRACGCPLLSHIGPAQRKEVLGSEWER